MGILYIVSTPIGNLDDITIRAIKIIFSVDYIACEDTRKTGLLLDQLQKRHKIIIQNIQQKEHRLVSYYDQKEVQKNPMLINYLEQDKDIALISDAGTPLIADPGFVLVREAIKRNINIICIPGPSALLTALVISGLPPDQCLFLEYPPEKQHKRLLLFNDLKRLVNSHTIHPTIVFYCAPHKLHSTLLDIKNTINPTEIVIARELTKFYEEIWRGSVLNATEKFKDPKGEFVLLFTV